MAPRALLTLAWGSSRAATSLALASAAWMLSGLSPSPLINGLLPAVVSIPVLLPVPARPRLGTVLQCLAGLMLLAIAARVMPWPVPGTFAALLLLSAGGQLVDLPVQHCLNASAAVPMAALRSGAEAGRLLGNGLAGILFPLGKALLQFSQALVLLLPWVALVGWLGARLAPTAPAAPISHRLEPAPLLQGIVFGALFGLIPLWVRQEGAGNCFDFAMVLTAYGLGRAAAEALPMPPRLGAAPGYLMIAAALACTQLLPGWGAVLLFVPIGVLASRCDQHLLQTLGPEDNPTLKAHRFNRSACLGGLLGSIAMGAAGQVLGLTGVLQLQLLAFGLAALVLPRLLPASRWH